ncbi:BMP family lipoprotein [Leuconostoc mesenteroides]|jgi:basic membrane protein A|uniref:BMP family ABC transporter substrate-binding protein n=1 Tax=Leuconostoc mesenteroides TaxID=1245 RepID=A0A843Z144_LEUME|nr:BMP family protein [Leuconostoc mesenteroides]ARN62924.1 BMP family ABC transporter substrate-binding protein [Leuconostoc mesenteroides subsp. mesenteroides]MBZ1514470.1 BMP family protein [Leuconostoc mesenteroides]MBZ1517564.1 BMP family protein [Leuconostoc mesenteroides]MBZ1520173.1 BMP family protein [Leuconostoc mesenteroides]MBZ1521912.1 BMP family protein [Leuconostoc mesenteroides]
MQRSAKIGIGVAAVVVIGGGIYAATQKSSTKSTGYAVALVTDGGGIDDRSFNQSAWEGLKAYGKANNLEQGKGGYNYFLSSDTSDIKTNLQTAVKGGYKLVYGVGFVAAPAVTSVSKANSKTNFAIIDSVVNNKNVASLLFKSEQSSYLAGVAAAKQTKSKTVGFVGGIHSDTIDTFEAGFKAGVKDTDSSIKVITQYTDSFTDAAKGKTIAASMVANGADVIFQAAGGAGNGVFAEAKAENQKLAANADKKVWVIGVDRDQKTDGNYKDKDGKASNFTLVSAVKRVDSAVEDVANKAKNDKFPGGKTITYGLKQKGVSLSKDSASEDVWSAVQTAQKKIISGKITVPVHP